MVLFAEAGKHMQSCESRANSMAGFFHLLSAHCPISQCCCIEKVAIVLVLCCAWLFTADNPDADIQQEAWLRST